MVTSSSAKIARAPGRILLNIATEPASTVYPFGGKEVGKVNQVRFTRNSSTIPIFHEGSGEIGDVLEGPNRYSFACFLRGWDDDAITTLFSGQASAGTDTGHAVALFPSLLNPGNSALARGVKILYVPDDVLNVPALLVYNAVPMQQEGADMLWGRSSELGMPMACECTRDAYGRVAAIGRLQDLQLVP